MRVLVADDNRDACETFALVLEGSGYETETAGDGVEALERLQARAFDAVVLDIDMPRKSGYAVLDEVAADPRLSKIPIIVITGIGFFDDDRLRHPRPELTVLEKPTDPAHLLKVLAAALRRAQ